MRGLLGRSRDDLPDGWGLWLEPASWIHTFGMDFAIDAVYLDRSGRVIRACHELKPFRLGPLAWRARGVLELPPGQLGRTQTRVGDIVEFVSVRD